VVASPIEARIDIAGPNCPKLQLPITELQPSLGIEAAPIELLNPMGAPVPEIGSQLKEGRDSDSHPPPSTGGWGYAPDPVPETKEKPGKTCGNLYFIFLPDVFGQVRWRNPWSRRS
jgi:hypothetical protein